jgi:hypothetical protein
MHGLQAEKRKQKIVLIRKRNVTDYSTAALTNGCKLTLEQEWASTRGEQFGWNRRPDSPG